MEKHKKIRQRSWFVDQDSNMGCPQYEECLQLHHKIQFGALIIIVRSNRYVPSHQKESDVVIWARFMKLRVGWPDVVL